jgi:ABC-2 type transport system ATP-binding protein
MLLRIDHLTKTYRNGTRANDDISLEVDQGQVFGLLGPNGAGKTTLVGQVLGSLVPTGGSIWIGEVDVTHRPDVARSACSYQPQTSVPIDGLTPVEAIEMAGRIRGGQLDVIRRQADELIADLDLGEWAGKMVPLSGGVARLVAFCMAAVIPGRIVVLDEPTNDIDPLRRKLLWNQVRRLADDGAAVLLVTHNVLEAERCVDRLAIIRDGRVLSSGTAAALKSRLGGALRLELVLEPGTPVPQEPEFARDRVTAGRRVIVELDAAAARSAVEWATSLRDSGLVEEFSLGPITLEDAYVREVGAASDADPDMAGVA